MKKILFLLLITAVGAPLIALGAESQSFVPLTSLPGIKDFSGQSSLPNLLNNIYKIAIGAAAVLAVLQIMRAGILYMGGDSVTEKKEAKNLLGMAIGGLLLVLSPVIVFSIINPEILNLNIGTIELNKLSTPDYSDSPNPEATKALCSQYTGPNLKTTARQTGKECKDVLGSGWSTLDNQCCSITDSQNMCCGYSESNKGTNTPAPNTGTGQFVLRIVQKDTTNGCYAELSNNYPTKAQCQSAQATASNNSSMAVDTDCDGNNIESPSARYSEIVKLPLCQ